MRGHKMEKADIFKFVGLIAFFAIMVLIVVMLWPYFHELFEPGGLDRIINDVRGAGPVGFLILLGLQFLQIVVAFIPGEVVQIAAGLLYGPWIGALVILAGCVISSAFIFALVRKLGAPFVQSMVPVQYLEKFRKFEKIRQAEHHRVHPVFDPGSAERRVHVPRAAHGHANAHIFGCSPTWGAFRASWCPPTPPTGWLTDALWKARSSSRWRPSSPCWASFFASAS